MKRTKRVHIVTFPVGTKAKLKDTVYLTEGVMTVVSATYTPRGTVVVVEDE